MVADAAFFVGALVATFLLSRLAWLVFRWVRPYALRFALVYALTAIATVSIAAFGLADGGPLDWSQAAVSYLPPLAVWLFADALRGRPLLVKA